MGNNSQQKMKIMTATQIETVLDYVEEAGGTLPVVHQI